MESCPPRRAPTFQAFPSMGLLSLAARYPIASGRDGATLADHTCLTAAGHTRGPPAGLYPPAARAQTGLPPLRPLASLLLLALPRLATPMAPLLRPLPGPVYDHHGCLSGAESVVWRTIQRVWLRARSMATLRLYATHPLSDEGFARRRWRRRSPLPRILGRRGGHGRSPSHSGPRL
jgi:hypothetical protein